MRSLQPQDWRQLAIKSCKIYDYYYWYEAKYSRCTPHGKVRIFQALHSDRLTSTTNAVVILDKTLGYLMRAKIAAQLARPSVRLWDSFWCNLQFHINAILHNVVLSSSMWIAGATQSNSIFWLQIPGLTPGSKPCQPYSYLQSSQRSCTMKELTSIRSFTWSSL